MFLLGQDIFYTYSHVYPLYLKDCTLLQVGGFGIRKYHNSPKSMLRKIPKLKRH